MKILERRLYGSNYFLKTHQNLKFLAIKTQKYLEITTDGNAIHYKIQPKGRFHFGS
jgi:hypothetical protein